MIPEPRKKAVKNRLRVLYNRVRNAVVRRLFSYDAAALLQALRKLGVRTGDAVMLHGAFDAKHGFQGTPGQVIDVFSAAVGAEGHLLMPSMAYQSSSLDYLARLESFNVRRTPSAMGLMSEFFRRRPGVLRSAHPSHPILVAGPKAAWFVAGHEQLAHSCGPGSPFEKLLAENGKVAFFNVGFGYFTFFHFLEDRVASLLPFPLYHEPTFAVTVIDADNRRLTVNAAAFSRETLRRRRFSAWEKELRAAGLIKQVRVGATTIMLVELPSVVANVDEMTRRGRFFYDMPERGESA